MTFSPALEEAERVEAVMSPHNQLSPPERQTDISKDEGGGSKGGLFTRLSHHQLNRADSDRPLGPGHAGCLHSNAPFEDCGHCPCQEEQDGVTPQVATMRWVKTEEEWLMEWTTWSGRQHRKLSHTGQVRGIMDDGQDIQSDSNDNVPVCANKPPEDMSVVFKVYKRRWFVLLVLCLLNSSNATLWLTFSPVADKSAQYLKATLDQINWLSLVYMMILGAWLNMLGALLRLIGTLGSLGLSDPYPLVMSGQTLCAVAQPLVIFAPTKLAALWFPENQRATANMIASMSNPVGLLFANILSPAIVTTYDRIPLLMLVYAIPACLVCFLATVGIRSSGPPTPPSASAESSASEPFVQGLKLLLRNRPYLVLLVCFGCGIAVFTCFSSLLEQFLCVRGYSNYFAGLCGSLFIVFGVIGAGVLGLFVDKTKMFTEVTKCTYPVGEATSTGLIFISGRWPNLWPTPRSPPAPLGGDATLSWRTSVLVMAGVFAVLTCLFIIIFNTPYRRIRAEAEAAQGSRAGFGVDCIDTVSQAVSHQGPLGEPRVGIREHGKLEPAMDC
ncbi:hypothetical protein CRUP_035648 [Coryphaenoides rupestris]|nr:hypothetical protein CRUP_035648 [Coryphaenoides rupestris]